MLSSGVNYLTLALLGCQTISGRRATVSQRDYYSVTFLFDGELIAAGGSGEEVSP